MKNLFLLPTLFILYALFVCSPCYAQKKFYATVFDEDNNPVARGFFKSAANSGIIILVAGMEVFINSSEISTLKIEKNPSTAQFLKLGVTAGSEVASYLINKPKKDKIVDDEVVKIDSIYNTIDSIAHGGNTQVAEHSSTENIGLLMETKDVLFQSLQELFQNLLIGTNDLATFSINQSREKFSTKLRLLQQYSIDKEIIVWSEVASSEVSQPNVEVVTEEKEHTSIKDEATQNNFSTSTVPLNKGFIIIGKPIVKSSTIVSNESKEKLVPRQSSTKLEPVAPAPSKKVSSEAPHLIKSSSKSDTFLKPRQ
jgi:hypothetical protein